MNDLPLFECRFPFNTFVYILILATLSSRFKRFLTPTTYPAVPTTFPVPTTMAQRTVQPVFAPFSDSRPINCPVKRDTRTHHVELDSNMMREIYLHEVGDWDKRLVAETLEEALENFIDLSRINHKTLVSISVL